MREIKFRAWDKRNKIMIFLTATAFGDIMDNHDKKDWVIMQFTGLKDKNGKEICDGDIVKLDCGSNEIFEMIYIIDESHQRCGFYYKSLNEDDLEDNSIHGVGSWNVKVKVIGNIYENPELMEQEQ